MDPAPPAPPRGRPDTEIKLFFDSKDIEEKERTLQELKLELLGIGPRGGAGGGGVGQSLVLHLAEDIHGNIFNKPFPFLHFRTLSAAEAVGAAATAAAATTNTSSDQDPQRDFFVTLRAVRRGGGGGGGGGDRACCSHQQTLAYIFMGYKVLNDDQAEVLDRTWLEWTGVRGLLRELDPVYAIRRVQCWKAINNKADIFKYGILIEIGGDDDDIHARDCLQRFRIKRMSGYVAMYKRWGTGEVEEAIGCNQSRAGSFRRD